MPIRVFAIAEACLFLLLVVPVRGQTSSKPFSSPPQQASLDKDPVAILELGAATSWNFSGGAAAFAPNFAAEVTPIEGWLEIEAGVSPFYTHNSTEMGHRSAFQETVDHIAEGGVHAGYRSRMGLFQAEWKSAKLHSWRAGGRLYVLANGQTSLRLVSRTGL